LNSFIDSSARTPPVMAMSRNGVCRDLAVGDHDLADLGGKLSN